MIARRLTTLLLLPAVLTAALHAAAPAGPDPKSANPAALLPGAKNPPAAPRGAVPPDGPAPVVAAPAAATATPEASAAQTPAPAPAEAAPDPAAAATAPATPAVKPGIFTAVKAKGPPPTAKGPAAPVPLSPRFLQVRMKIGALFDTRNTPPAPLDPRANPFRIAGAGAPEPLPVVEGAEPAPIAANNDLTLLQQAVATLRVKGTFQPRGKGMQLVITSAPGKEGSYKEGDVINVVMPTGDPVHLRVRAISARSVTLTLNEAEMVLKF